MRFCLDFMDVHWQKPHMEAMDMDDLIGFNLFSSTGVDSKLGKTNEFCGGVLFSFL